MEMYQLHMCITAVITAILPTVHGYLPTYYMDELCTTTLDLGVQGIEAGRLLLRPPGRGLRYLNCFVFLKAPPGRRLSFRFRVFNVQSPFDCDMDNVQLFDDRLMRLELTERLCNRGQTPEGVYTTTAQDGTVRLMKKTYLEDQIELIFTAFHLAPCTGDEFQCQNSHCIAKSLYCNGYVNCGDESDICLLNEAAITGVIVAAIIVIILIAVIVAVLLYRRQQHRRMEKMQMHQWVVVQDGKGQPFLLHETQLHYVEPLDKKHSVSKSPSTSSSRLSKNGMNHEHSLDAAHPDDALSKKSNRSSKKHGKGSDSKIPFNPLRSSSMKKDSAENDGYKEVYAVPKKPSKKMRRKRLGSSTKYVNDPDVNQHSSVSVVTSPSGGVPPQMEEISPSLREGMKGQEESELSLHTLDPSALPGASPGPHSPNVYDHVLSFRSYASPEPQRKERVVYLYPGHPGYNRLHQHNHDETLKSDQPSLHSSRSSLVKL